MSLKHNVSFGLLFQKNKMVDILFLVNGSGYCFVQDLVFSCLIIGGSVDLLT